MSLPRVAADARSRAAELRKPLERAAPRDEPRPLAPRLAEGAIVNILVGRRATEPFGEARRKAEAAMQEKMQSLTGGLGLPPGLSLT